MDVYKEDWEARYPREATQSWNGKPVWPESAVKQEEE